MEPAKYTSAETPAIQKKPAAPFFAPVTAMQGQSFFAAKGQDNGPAAQPFFAPGPVVVQPKLAENTREENTGLPQNLKLGIEHFSGIDMNDVRVNYNSEEPDNIGAHAYTQGSIINIGPGQEKHLPHEAWSVVQQKQGRVKTIIQMQDKANANDNKNPELKKELDGMLMIIMIYMES